MIRRVLVAAACAGLVWAAIPSAPAATGAAMVTGVYGSLDIQRGGSHLPGKVRTMLRAGDIVTTNDRSRAVLLLSDGSLIKLQVETSVQISQTKGMHVLNGEVFAHMAKQHGAFTFEVPHGRLGVVGTDLDVQVAHASLTGNRDAVTTLTVAKGTVDFSSGAKVAHAVRVGAGTQSVLAMKGDTGTSAEAALEPSAPVQVDVDPIIAWQTQVQQYGDAMARLYQQFELLEADTQAHSGFVSPTLMDQLNDDEDMIQNLVPDDDFQAGHQDLLLAYQNLKLSLTMTANPQLMQQSRQKAEAAFHAADLAFQAYKAKYQRNMNGFLQH